MKIARMFILMAFVLCCFGTAYSQPAETWKTGQTTSYAAGDDGDRERGVAWPDPRFTDNGNGTVTDNLTGLIWLKNANCAGYMNWNNALNFCKNLSSGSYGLTDGSVAGDWRLPNRKELLSLIDYSRYNPALPQGHPFTNVQSSWYWSATTYAIGTYYAWVVYMYYGNVYYNDKTDGSNYVWPVRGGQSGSLGNLTISYPNQGETLTKGSNYTIRWTSQNITGSVQIDLYKGGTDPQYMLLQLAAAAENNGQYSFSPPDDLADGDDYYIGISAENGTVWDFSDVAFRIEAPSPIDTDGDGTPDAEDVFPNDPNESLDSDNDGVGNNADLDDDNDGYSDEEEVNAGSDPLNPDSKPSLPPAPPILSSPSNNAVDVDPNNVVLQWNPSSDPDGDAVEYCVTVKEDGSPEDISVYIGCDNEEFTTETTFTLPVKLEGRKKYWWAVWAKDNKGNWSEASDWWGFNSAETPTPSIIIETSLPKGEPNIPYRRDDQSAVILSATGGVEPYTWAISLDELPPGLSLNESTGEIYGTPTTAGNYGFAVRVVDVHNHIATKILNITIRPIMQPSENNESKRYALIIGGNYPGSNVNTLAPALQFANYLQETAQWGFKDNVYFLYENISWQRIQEVLNDIKLKLREGDHFLLYISGHGGTEAEEPYGNEEGLISQTFFHYTGYIQETYLALQLPSLISIEMSTKDDEYLQLPVKDSENPENFERVYDDDLTAYFLSDSNWSKVNKYAASHICVGAPNMLWSDYCFSDRNELA
jgi:hypothetical protein